MNWNWREHTLSLALLVGSIVFIVISRLVEHGTWEYDFFMGVGLAFFGSFTLVVLARWLWEKDSDPTKPPE